MRNPPDRKRKAAPPSDQVVNEAAALGRQVREARKRLRLDQEDVAFAAHVSPRTVFAIEKGKPTVRLDMLARVLAAVGLRLSAERRDVVWQPGAEERK
ncbi:MAG: helix-turn-helix domain-containing protein [Chloroflexota bacterium]